MLACTALLHPDDVAVAAITMTFSATECACEFRGTSLPSCCRGGARGHRDRPGCHRTIRRASTRRQSPVDSRWSGRRPRRSGVAPGSISGWCGPRHVLYLAAECQDVVWPWADRYCPSGLGGDPPDTATRAAISSLLGDGGGCDFGNRPLHVAANWRQSPVPRWLRVRRAQLDIAASPPGLLNLSCHEPTLLSAREVGRDQGVADDAGCR